jgi:hypothetical protein
MTDTALDPPAAETRTSGLPGRWFGIALWKRIMAALVLGGAVGLVWGEGATAIAWIGELFVRLIRMLVVPLVFLTIASGVAALADPKRLGSIGVKTLAMYVFTTSLAVTTGLIVATLIAPGAGASFAGAIPKALAEAQDPARMFIEIIPDIRSARWRAARRCRSSSLRSWSARGSSPRARRASRYASCSRAEPRSCCASSVS